MKYYIIKIGNGMYYNQKRDTFTSYREYATKYKNEQQADKVIKWFKENGIIYEFIGYKNDDK